MKRLVFVLVGCLFVTAALCQVAAAQSAAGGKPPLPFGIDANAWRNYTPEAKANLTWFHERSILVMAKLTIFTDKNTAFEQAATKENASAMAKAAEEIKALSGEIQLKYSNISRTKFVDNFVRPTVTLSCDAACSALYFAGEALKKADDTDGAKIIFRQIVSDFQGPRYHSWIKKAEFALEDLRSK
jgi:hypothetical protein